MKAKSMVGEEVELNHALEAAGIRAMETDLGEFIIQLAGERPAHIVAPAIHKTREDVSELFVTHIQAERTVVPEQLTAIARRALREMFQKAGVGVSGANFAVAETGTVVLVENEGNIRMCTTVPRVHVALVGIEKLIPRLADLGVFLRLLGRSATGQKLTTYTSLLTGPRRPGEDGPEEMHVVMVDNGRTAALADPKMREMLYCIRCGACLNTCPVYRKIGGHAYGWVYSGPIGALVTPELVGIGQARELPFASSLCGACREVCPVRINIPDLLLHLRSQAQEHAPKRQESLPAGAAHVPSVGLGDAPPAPLRAGHAAGSLGAGPAGAPGLDSENSAVPRFPMDQGPRLPSARAEGFSRPLETASRRVGMLLLAGPLFRFGKIFAAPSRCTMRRIDLVRSFGWVALMALPAMWSLQPARAAEGPLPPANLRCEYLKNPLGIDVLQPRFAWVLAHTERGQKQTAYQVLVASSLELLNQDKGDLWDSGKTASEDSDAGGLLGKTPGERQDLLLESSLLGLCG